MVTRNITRLASITAVSLNLLLSSTVFSAVFFGTITTTEEIPVAGAMVTVSNSSAHISRQYIPMSWATIRLKHLSKAR